MPNPSTIAMEDERATLRDPNICDPLTALEKTNAGLLEALGKTSQQALEMKESRDRCLRENCDMTQKIRDLAEIARAAARSHKAEHAFVTAIEDEDSCGFPSDAVTEEAATAAAELEMLLEKHAALYQR